MRTNPLLLRVACGLGLFFCSVASLSAEQFGLFTYEVVEGSVTITDYPNNGVGEVGIPAEIEGRPVSSIGAAAFRSCDGLTDITIPPGVTSIGDNAFRRCTGLMTALFLGDAPEFEDDAFSSVDPEFTFYYLNGRSGFSSQSWRGHPTIRIDEALQISAVFSISFTPDGLRLMLPPIGRLGPLVLPLVNFDRDIGVEYSPDLSPGSWIELGNFFPVRASGCSPIPTRCAWPGPLATTERSCGRSCRDSRRRAPSAVAGAACTPPSRLLSLQETRLVKGIS